MMGDFTRSTFFVSVDRLYWISSRHNFSGCKVAFTISLSRIYRRWDCFETWKSRYYHSYILKNHPDWLGNIALMQKRIPFAVRYPHIGYSLQLCLLGIVILTMMHSYQCQVCLRQRTSHWILHSIPTQKMLQFIGFQNRCLSDMVMHSYPWCAGWWWSACLFQWIRFCCWITWLHGVGFLSQMFLDNRCGVAKVIVHVVGGRENVVTGFFKTECGGCHVTINRCSGKNFLRLGYCWCYFLGLRATFL